MSVNLKGKSFLTLMDLTPRRYDIYWTWAKI